MTQTSEAKPKPPKGAVLLEVGQIIQDGDLHWNPTVKRWLAVAPQGEEKVEPEVFGFYARKNDER
jgi:hypothetical protein